MSQSLGPSLLLGIPAHNEEAIIAESVRRVTMELGNVPFSWHVVVLDNASSDDTAARVRQIHDPRVSVLHVPLRGKGHAVRAGARHAIEKGASVYGFIDADLSADPKHIRAFFDEIASGKTDIVVGSRLLEKNRVKRGIFRTLSSELFNVFRRLLLGIPVRDTQCGLKLHAEEATKILSAGIEGGWFWDMEFLAHAHRAGLSIKEMAVEWDEFRFPDRASKLRVFRDGIVAVVTMVRIRMRMLRSSGYGTPGV